VKRVLILGCTGSIGVQALDVIDGADDMVCVGLAAGSRVAEMLSQADSRGIAVTCAAAGGGSVQHTSDLGEVIDRCEPDIVLNAIVGAAGLPPTLAAIERGIPVALANKESLVAGGDLVAAAQARSGAMLVPVDSEHSALFQLIEGVDRARVVRGVLTASGGPFRGRTAEDLAEVTVADALAHPTWTMGAKITIDSATLMNKGLEVIEAHHLFDLSYDDIEVVVHPQSTIHAMVRLEDGSLITHMGPPDMRVPIGYALRWPEPPPAWVDRRTEEQFGTFLSVVGAIREIRSRQNVPPKTKLTVQIRSALATAELLAPMRGSIESMAGATLGSVGPDATGAPGAATAAAGHGTRKARERESLPDCLSVCLLEYCIEA
jgi:1-deoxy-D-xylulose-5-phosphate reductoisomerase